MPKVLSLKKTQQAAPSKNQKSITHFFKNTNVPATQNIQKSPVKTNVSHEQCMDKKSVKRKASSLVQLETIEILDEPCVNIVQDNNSFDQNEFHTSKKLKSDYNSVQRSPIKNANVDKKSPEKENSMRHKQTPIKSPSHLRILQKVEIDVYELDSSLEQRKDRSPLTPVDIKNSIENEETDCKLSQNNEYNKSSPNKIENHVKNTERGTKTPKKVLQFESYENSIHSPERKNRTPRKSKVPTELCCSPRIAKLKTEKINSNDQSPSKSGSTVRALDFTEQAVEDAFGDEWDFADVDENSKEDLDLSIMQRCEVLSLTRHPTRLELKLKNSANNRGTCFVGGIWIDTPVSPGEIISVIATRDSLGQFYVGNNSGLLTLRPDHLMSSTSVVAGVFCKRKALLQERWRGIDSANTAMTIGILIHELVQKALTQNIKEIAHLRSTMNNILKESVQLLYDAGISEEEARSNMQTYIPPLSDFMQTYMNAKSASKPQKDQWCGQIDNVLDIEENMCCPQLGLKGKIDATLQVTIHERKGARPQRAIVPLELKSGKASVSAEHRGQLVLYGMMLSLQRNEDPTTSLQRGLLLYLKERVDLREVSCGYPERRDLVMLRNQLVQYLAPGPQDVDPEQLTDIEDAACLLQQNLPEPVHHQTACAKCPYLTLCSLHLWHTDGPSVSETHPLARLRDQALGHLSSEHIKYFLQWTALLKMEERGQMLTSPLHALWTDNVDKRSKRGTCAANLKLKSVEASSDRYLHVFERQTKEKLSGDSSKATNGPQEGEFSIVSIENRPWIAAGVVTVANEKEINILLERDLSRRLDKSTLFHIDTYESYATTVQNLTNLGVLLEDSDRALRLRRLIIDKEAPQFEKKLPREVGRLGTKVMRSLNIQQQRAVLKALAAKDYALLQGLPGTGKTQTISVLIQMLVGLKQRVLVTAHTHSAVDTVLSRLPDTMKVMRLGSSSRVAAGLRDRCEQQLAVSLESTEQLEKLYNSMDVVGVTCLGANHAMLARTAFDICIVDEATQVLQCTVLRPLFAAKRFILVGDPEQLPPVVRSRAARRLGMEESLFHRLLNEDVTSTLQLQYRMNQALADIANRVAYNSRLMCSDQKVAEATLDIDVKKLAHHSPWLQKAASQESQYAALFLDMETVTDHQSGAKSCTNVDEACVVLALVDVLIEGGVKPSEIGVIAPYRDQVTLLRRVLFRRGAEGSTVDQFQGRDKSVIVYSCTKRDHDDRKIKEGEILNDQRRLAVSVTRAKHKLIVVGNSRALQRYTPLQRLIEACTKLPLENDIVARVVNKYRTEFV